MKSATQACLRKRSPGKGTILLTPYLFVAFGLIPLPITSSLTGRAAPTQGNRAGSVSALLVFCDQSTVGRGGGASWQGSIWWIRDSQGDASIWLAFEASLMAWLPTEQECSLAYGHCVAQCSIRGPVNYRASTQQGRLCWHVFSAVESPHYMFCIM